MKKRGFTLVELIVSFSLAVIICVFLLQLVLTLRTIYTTSGVKTEILSKQALISNQLNRTFNQKSIFSLDKCGNYCIKFNYTDNTSDILKIDFSNNILEFGNFKTRLPNDTYFKDVNLEIISSATIYEGSNDTILSIKIPIYNDDLKDEDFGVNVIYQFNSGNTDIQYVDFAS